jgi:hypothetical protein
VVSRPYAEKHTDLVGFPPPGGGNPRFGYDVSGQPSRQFLDLFSRDNTPAMVAEFLAILPFSSESVDFPGLA